MKITELIEECEKNKKKWLYNPLDDDVIGIPYFYGKDYILWIKKCSKFLRKYYALNDDAIRFIELAKINPHSCYEEVLDEMLACLKMIEENDDGKELEINNNELFSVDLISGANSYYIKLLNNINTCYKYGIYDASYILIRKLINSIIIDIIEKNKDIDEIYDGVCLKDFRGIINVFLNKSYWKYSKGVNDTLNKIRIYGNSSTHNKYYIANKNDIDREYDNIRFLIEELFLNIK